jgi:hypothetical protein
MLTSAIATAPALADPFGVFGSAVSGANTAIKNVENAKPPASASQNVAQVPPVTQQPVGGPQAVGLPVGWTYTLDASSAYPFGNIGTLGKRWLPGGVDGVVGFGVSPNLRVVLNYYEIQHYPVGFNSGQVPLFLPPGFPPTPGVNPSCVDLSGATSATCTGINPQFNVTTKDRFGLALFEKLIDVGSYKHRAIPIVLTPTYVSRWSTIAASNGNGDVVPFVSVDGRPFTNVTTRSVQDYALALTVPLLKTPKMFGTFTVAPTWLVHPAGANVTNHPQLYQILYLEYTPFPRTKLFVEPQASRDYLPEDVYPEHNMAYFAGISQSFGKMVFAQLVLNSGGPSNISPYGVKQLNCYALPCSSNTLPVVGGLKATQLQFQIGIGSPSVIQF